MMLAICWTCTAMAQNPVPSAQELKHVAQALINFEKAIETNDDATLCSYIVWPFEVECYSDKSKGSAFSDCIDLSDRLPDIIDAGMLRSIHLFARSKDMTKHMRLVDGNWSFTIDRTTTKLGPDRPDEYSRLLRFYYSETTGLQLLLIFCAG